MSVHLTLGFAPLRTGSIAITDANNGVTTITQHARIEGLHPDTDYVYKIVSDGQTQMSSAFRTAPEGRAAFTFTTVGDFGCGDTAYAKASLNAIATAAQIESFTATRTRSDGFGFRQRNAK